MSSGSVSYEVTDAVATVTITRPDAMNAADRSVRIGLRSAFERAGGDAGVRAVVVTGVGRAFCVGQDLKELEPLYASGDPELAGIVGEFNATVRALRGLAKPTIAAVNGAAAGAGMSIALACDLRIASDAASFLTAFSNVGLVPDSGATWTLPRIVGWPRALEMFLLSERVDAEAARKLGIVSRVVPADSFAKEVQEFAARLAAGPTVAYNLTKQLLGASSTTTLEESLDLEEQGQSTVGRTADHMNAVKAFLAKEKPVFEGK